MVETVRCRTSIAEVGALGTVHVCLCVRLPYDVAVHRTLAYAKSYSSDTACIPYRLHSSSCIEARLMMIAGVVCPSEVWIPWPRDQKSPQ